MEKGEFKKNNGSITKKTMTMLFTNGKTRKKRVNLLKLIPL